jgi:hypothetical protein
VIISSTSGELIKRESFSHGSPELGILAEACLLTTDITTLMADIFLVVGCVMVPIL